MILEILEWAITPATWTSRRSGLLAEQIAIRHRRSRCAAAWQPHLDSCKAFVASHTERSDSLPRNCVILGSGHLNDIDLTFLQKNFSLITLVDAVHPIEIQLRAFLSFGRLRLVACDLSGMLSAKAAPTGVKLDPQLLALVSSADWAISSCLLSQLPLHPPCFKDDSHHIESIHAVYAAHLNLLRRSRNAILITDTARRLDLDPTWHSLLHDFPLPAPSATWTWLLAPPGEKHSDSGESRRVEAFTFSSGS
ncbi:MAG: hypothetical protein NTZ94_08355 [Verrucomicrobia bacterium]|nr:hypothetical protein [Verrucomicrobiota bacterium]